MAETGNIAKHAAEAGSLGNVQRVLVAGGSVCSEVRGGGEQDRSTAVGAAGGVADLRNDEQTLQSPGREITRSFATLQRAMKNS